MTTAIRFPPDVHEALQKAAEERGLAMNYLVVVAVKELLADLVPAEEMLLRRHARPGGVS